MKTFKKVTIVALSALIMLVPLLHGAVLPVCGESGGPIKDFKQNAYVDALLKHF